MQENVLVDPAVVGIEILVVPLVRRAGGLLPVRPAIVDLSRQDVGLIVERDIADIKAKGHDPVLAATDPLAIKVELPGVTDAFELEKDVLIPARGWQVKVFPVPGNSGGQVGNVHAESIIFVPRMGEGYVLPIVVVEGRRLCGRGIAHEYFPPRVEVVFHPAIISCLDNEQEGEERKD